MTQLCPAPRRSAGSKRLSATCKRCLQRAGQRWQLQGGESPEAQLHFEQEGQHRTATCGAERSDVLTHLASHIQSQNQRGNPAQHLCKDSLLPCLIFFVHGRQHSCSPNLSELMERLQVGPLGGLTPLSALCMGRKGHVRPNKLS